MRSLLLLHQIAGEANLPVWINMDHITAIYVVTTTTEGTTDEIMKTHRAQVSMQNGDVIDVTESTTEVVYQIAQCRKALGVLAFDPTIPSIN